MQKIKKIAIILFGASGSGKGTQGKFLEQEIKFKRYIMSDLIKLELKSEIKVYDKIINKGNLMSDDKACKIFEKYFNLEERVIIDGMPRKEEEGIWLYNLLIKNNYLIKFIYLNVTKENLLNRILLRAKKENRLDDCKEIFENKLKQFNKTKNKILNIYKDNLIDIKGDKKIIIVQKEIFEKLHLSLKNDNST